MKQRLAIIRALFHDPKVVFLDEPTAGLDPEAALEVRELIARLKTEGRTILVCTHNLDEAERLADSVGILRRRLLLCDTLERLRGGTDGDGRLTVRVTITGPAALHAPAFAAGPVGLDVRDVRAVDSTLTARCAPAEVPALVAWLVGRGAGIREVRSEAESLEAVYLRAVRGER
jgi:ABC-2 type transport system ATP-binding protein